MSRDDQHGVEQAGGLQLGEQCLVQPLPHPGLLPLANRLQHVALEASNRIVGSLFQPMPVRST